MNCIVLYIYWLRTPAQNYTKYKYFYKQINSPGWTRRQRISAPHSLALMAAAACTQFITYLTTWRWLVSALSSPTSLDGGGTIVQGYDITINSPNWRKRWWIPIGVHERIIYLLLARQTLRSALYFTIPLVNSSLRLISPLEEKGSYLTLECKLNDIGLWLTDYSY